MGIGNSRHLRIFFNVLIYSQLLENIIFKTHYTRVSLHKIPDRSLFLCLVVSKLKWGLFCFSFGNEYSKNRKGDGTEHRISCQAIVQVLT